MKKVILFLPIFWLTTLPNSGLVIEKKIDAYNINKNTNEYKARIIPDQYLDLVMEMSSRFGVPIYVVSALIYYESSYVKDAFHVNSNGTYDQGLMQLNSSNYEWFKEKFNNGQDFDPNEPRTNVRIGCQYLHWLYNVKKSSRGSWFRSVCHWNGNKESSRILAKKVCG